MGNKNYLLKKKFILKFFIQISSVNINLYRPMIIIDKMSASKDKPYFNSN